MKNIESEINLDEIDELIQKVEEVKSRNNSHDTSEKTSTTVYPRTDEPDTLSVYELRNPNLLNQQTSEGTFYSLVRDIYTLLLQERNESKFKSRRLKKIQNHLKHMCNTMEGINASLHIDNMIKLYEKGLISEDSLIGEIEKTNNIDINIIYDII